MTVNVVNPSKHNSLRDLRTGTLPGFWHALKYWKKHYGVWVSKSSCKQWNFNSNHSWGRKSAVIGFDDTRLYPHISESNDMSDSNYARLWNNKVRRMKYWLPVSAVIYVVCSGAWQSILTSVTRITRSGTSTPSKSRANPGAEFKIGLLSCHVTLWQIPRKSLFKSPNASVLTAEVGDNSIGNHSLISHRRSDCGEVRITQYKKKKKAEHGLWERRAITLTTYCKCSIH